MAGGTQGALSLREGGGRFEKRKDRKTLKIRNEEKITSFSSASLFPARKWQAIIRVETKGR